MNPFNHTLISTCRMPIRFFGIITCGAFACFFLVLSAAYFHSRSLDQESVERLVRQSSMQQIRALQLSIDTLTLDRAVQTKNWDRVEPALNDLITNHNAWVNTHESLVTERANAFHAPGDEDSIADYYTQLTYAYSNVSQAIDELRIVGQSIVRRAPFIDPSSEARLTAAVESYQTHEPRFDQISAQINALYKLQAQQAAGNSAASIRRALGFMLASIVIMLGLGVAPRLKRLNTKRSVQESIPDTQPNHQYTTAHEDQPNTRKAA